MNWIVHSIYCVSLFRTWVNFTAALVLAWGTRWRSWLRHSATSRKVAGSIPEGVIGIFHWHNSSSHTMALRLTQSATEMGTRNISWGVKRPVRTADNLNIIMWRLFWNLGASDSWKPQGMSMPVMGLLALLLELAWLYLNIWHCTKERCRKLHTLRLKISSTCLYEQITHTLSSSVLSFSNSYYIYTVGPGVA